MKFFKVFQLIRENRILFLIILVGVALRFWGIVPGYLPYHSDEHQSYGVAAKLIFERQLHPDYYAYPSLIPLIHASFYLIIFIPLNVVSNLFTHSSFEGIKQGITVDSLYWGRYVSAFLGSISIIVVYILASRFFNNKFVGLLSALFLAVNYRHVLQSHFALFDVPNGLFLMLALIAAYEIFQKQSAKSVVFGGIVLLR